MLSWLGGRNALARRAHTEALRLAPERRVELAAEVFQRDRRGQFDDLLFAEMLFEAREQRLVSLLAGDRHALGVVERDAFALAEQCAVAPVRQLPRLRLALLAFHHTDGIDVDS